MSDFDSTIMGTALFPDRVVAVARLRRDRLIRVAENHLPDIDLEDSYIWDALVAAEANVSRTLRVSFRPTAYFSTAPTQQQIDALNGMPWEEDAGYDYDPAMYTGDRWGFIQTHHLPIVRVDRMRFAYPASGATFDIPAAWLQVNKKYGHVQVVPMSPAAAALSPFMLQLISSGRVIPNMIQLDYVAGLTDVINKYPDLVDAVKKTAVLRILEDSFLPQSGSISGDGLSQSMSMDMGKYEDSVDRILNGAEGTNGGLKAAIHGIRMAVF